MRIHRHRGTAQRRGEGERETEALQIEHGEKVAIVASSWPWPEDVVLPPTDQSEQLRRRHQGAVQKLDALVIDGERLEASGSLTPAGVAERMQRPAKAVRAALEEFADYAASVKNTALHAMAEMPIPGADSPYAAELRAAVRSMTPRQRVEAVKDFTDAELGALVAAPPIVSGLPRELHAALRAKVVDPKVEEPYRATVERAEHLAATLAQIHKAVDVVAPAPKAEAQSNNGSGAARAAA